MSDIDVEFALSVAGRWALATGHTNGDAWEWSVQLAVVPARDSWVRLPGTSVRARAGHAEHMRYYPNQTVWVPLALESLSESDAAAIGVEWHPWMNETLAPKPVDEKKAKQDDATRDEFEQWRQIRAEKVADDGV